MPRPIRSFTVGETVHLTSRVSVPGTSTPTDPATVALTSMKRGTTEILDGASNFTRLAEGEYSLVVQTVDLDPGTYQLTVTHSDGPLKVTVVQDSFVLQSG